MKKTLWICLLTLAVVMSFFSSHGFGISHSCCVKAYAPWKTDIGPIKKCFEQKQRGSCLHAFLIITNSDEEKCLKPDTPWLKQEINEGRLRCPLEFSVTGRFEVLDEDDLE